MGSSGVKETEEVDSLSVRLTFLPGLSVK